MGDGSLRLLTIHGETVLNGMNGSCEDCHERGYASWAPVLQETCLLVAHDSRGERGSTFAALIPASGLPMSGSLPPVVRPSVALASFRELIAMSWPMVHKKQRQTFPAVMALIQGSLRLTPKSRFGGQPAA